MRRKELNELITAVGATLRRGSDCNVRYGLPVRWCVDLPRDCPSSHGFPSLGAVEAWVRGWTAGLIAEERAVEGFRSICLSADAALSESIHDWVRTNEPDPALGAALDEVERIYATVAPLPRRWKADALRLMRIAAPEPWSPLVTHLKNAYERIDAHVLATLPRATTCRIDRPRL